MAVRMEMKSKKLANGSQSEDEEHETLANSSKSQNGENEDPCTW
jgi:hypothetical protein